MFCKAFWTLCNFIDCYSLSALISLLEDTPGITFDAAAWAYICFGYALAYCSARPVAVIVAVLCVAIAYCTILCGRDGFAT